MHILKLAVSATVGSDEVVAVVGNTSELGQWQHKNAVILNQDGEGGKWRTEIKFTETKNISYRYFLGKYMIDGKGVRNLIVWKWEVMLKDNLRTVDLTGGELEIDDGEFGEIDGKTLVDQGWLCGQTEIRFHISDAGNGSVVSWTNKAESIPEELFLSFETDDDTPSGAVLIKPYTPLFIPPDVATELPKGNDMVLTYIAQTMTLNHFSARFVVSDGVKKMIGVANVVGDMLQNSVGNMRLALLNDKHKAVGSLNVEYLVIRTYKNNLPMEESFSKHWKKRPTLNIGHRGSGNSFTSQTTSDFFENTISSFKKAALHSAAMIEFDVQLTKDKVPIIFHDFTLCATVVSKNGRSPSLHEVELQSMKYEDLQTYYVRHRSRKTSMDKSSKFAEDDTRPHFTPFPPLEDVFKEVPEHVGFDIELKWPHYYSDKTWEHGVNRYFDANEFLDCILDVVYEHAANRRILFSCFEANICTMLRRKQNKYPVLLLTNGDSGHYQPFMDLRCRYNPMAISFAVSEKLLGLVTLEKDAYADHQLVKKVHDAGLVFMLYGDDIAEPKNRDLLTKQGVDGIIYDRIHNALPEGGNVYVKELNKVEEGTTS